MSAIRGNPEVVRHWRIELRPARVAATVAVTAILCGVALLLAALQPGGLRASAGALFRIFLLAQYGLLGIWAAGACGDALARERAERTFDFWRTTRLTEAELLVGLVLGRPVIVAVAVGISLPLSAGLAILAGESPWAWLATYALLPIVGALCGLLGVWVSLTSSRSGSGAAGLVALGAPSLGSLFLASPFVGLGALGIWPVVASLYPDTALPTPTLFGMSIPWLLAGLLVDGTAAGWLVLMLRRNLKREIEDLQFLSRREAVAFAACVYLLSVAFLDPARLGDGPRPASMAVMLVLALLYLVGLFILAPRDRLRAWWRGGGRRRWMALAEEGLPWPWLVLVAITGYLVFLGASRTLGAGADAGPAGMQIALATVFAIRDVLFLQRCRLTAMKSPVAAGVAGLLLLYAVLGGLRAGLYGGGSGGEWLWLPWSVLVAAPRAAAAWAALQVGVIGLLLLDIGRRLQRRRPGPGAPPAAPVGPGA